jgi:opacity protein-like surface antigen
MTRVAGLFVLLAVLAGPALAQDSQAPTPEGQAPSTQGEETQPKKVKRTYPTPKAEISAGFTDRGYYGSSASSISMIGAYGSYTYNFYKWLALEGEGLGVAGTLKLPNFPPESLHVFTALAGPKIYPLGHHRLDPFGHFNYGLGVLDSSVPEFAGYGGNQNAVFVKAWQVGGGLDLSLKQHWAVRLIQFDYTSAKFLGPNVPNQNGKRVSVGIVYRFGPK